MYSRIYLSPPHMGIYEQEYIDQAFITNWIAPTGPNVEAFEREMADYVGVRDAVALSSGTAAIHLALKLLNVSRGDLVFCSSLTFSASANPIIYEGAVPVFIDSEPGSWNMSPQALETAFNGVSRLGKKPRAAVIVNLYGQSADYDELLEICNAYNVPVIEDAAESLGATYHDKRSGSLGKFGIFSFNGNKIITTSGGGMLVSNDTEALNKARYWATQARDQARHYQHSEIGYNYRLSNVLAGIGRGQLRVIEERLSARRKIFTRYREELADFEGIGFMPEAAYGRSNCWLTVMTINQAATGLNASELMDAMDSENIESRPVWKPLHLQPVFKHCDYYPHSTGSSISEGLFWDGICLPSGSNLKDAEQERIIAILKKILAAGKVK